MEGADKEGRREERMEEGRSRMKRGAKKGCSTPASSWPQEVGQGTVIQLTGVAMATEHWSLHD